MAFRLSLLYPDFVESDLIHAPALIFTHLDSAQEASRLETISCPNGPSLLDTKGLSIYRLACVRLVHYVKVHSFYFGFLGFLLWLR